MNRIDSLMGKMARATNALQSKKDVEARRAVLLNGIETVRANQAVLVTVRADLATARKLLAEANTAFSTDFSAAVSACDFRKANGLVNDRDEARVLVATCLMQVMAAQAKRHSNRWIVICEKELAEMSGTKSTATTTEGNKSFAGLHHALLN